MKNFEEWKVSRSKADAEANKMLIVYMIIVFAVSAFCA
jgi:hypothetical protein